MSNILSADFETNNHIDDCRVWLWGCCELDGSNYEWGTDLPSFMDWLMTYKSPVVYFHNLRFDANFMISFFLRQGYMFTEEYFPQDKEFSLAMSNKGQLFYMKLRLGKNLITWYDSMKLFPFPLEALPGLFGFSDDMEKGSIDYEAYRPPGYIPTANELSYQKSDVLILARALHYFIREGYTKTTIGANALRKYKDLLGERQFTQLFPPLAMDEYLRASYRGGISYLAPRFAGKVVKYGYVYDVNSLYPYVLHEKPLPYGEPIYYTGEYTPNKEYPLYICRVILDVQLKKGKIPCLQLKRNFRYKENEYITRTKQPEEVCLTSADIELIRECYDCDIIFLDGYMFKASPNMFKPYINHYMEIKIQADKEKNKAMRTLAKLFLNNLYGKFGTNPERQNKQPYLDEEGVVRWKLLEPVKGDPVYLPVASFVTAYARAITVRAANENYDNFIYCDTDSLHLTALAKGIEVDPYRLGAWKKENFFKRGKFLRQKTYCEELYSEKEKKWKLHITCAGMPSRCYKHVNLKNFKLGASFKGHLQTKSAKGGVCLLRNMYTIK